MGRCQWAPQHLQARGAQTRPALTSATLLLTAPIMCSRHCSTPTPLPLFSRWVAMGITCHLERKMNK